MAINIRFKGIIGTLAQIALDKFAGRVAWATDLARMIWYYDANNYGEIARRDVLETFAGGIQDSTVTSGQALVAGASGRIQSQDASTFLATIHAMPEEPNDLLAGRYMPYGTGGEVGFVGVRNRSDVFAVDVGQPYGSEVYQQKFSGTGAYHGLRQRIRADAGGATTVADVMTWNPSGIFFALALHDSLGTQRFSATGSATLASIQAANLSGSGTRPLVADASGNIAIGIGNASAITVVQNVTQTPPGSPVTGIPYLVATGATGAWAGQDDNLATWSGSAWSFAARSARSICYSLTTLSPVNATFTSGVEAFSVNSFWATGLIYANAGLQSADLALAGDHAIVADSTGKLKNLGTATREMIIQPLPITNAAPDVVTVGPSGSMRSFGFDGVTQTEELFYHIDLQHDYIAGTDLIPHVHWLPSTSATGNVVWKWDYQWVESGGTFGAPTTASCPAVAAGGTAWVDKRSEVTISGAGHTYNSRLLLRLYRDPSDAGDTYGADAVLSSIGVHYSANPTQVG